MLTLTLSGTKGKRKHFCIFFFPEVCPGRGGNAGILRHSASRDDRGFRLASPYVSKRCEKCILVHEKLVFQGVCLCS